MIEGYLGRPGAGKSFAMTYRAFRERKRYDEIITNYGLAFGQGSDDYDGPAIIRFSGAQEFVDLMQKMLYRPDGKKRLVLLDEVHSLLDARNWAKVPQEILMALAQPRKALLDLYYTAQHESQVEKRLRIVTNWLWRCESFGQGFNFFSETPLFFKASCYDAFEYGKPRADRFGSRFFSSRKVHKHGYLYDTMEVLYRIDLSEAGTLVSQGVER